MKICFIAISLAAAVGVTFSLATAQQVQPRADLSESQIPIGDVSLYARSVGRGHPAIVLHGGPDFDHSYLLPELNQLKDMFRLIYYDQRGRGRSAEHVKPEEVSLASDIEDIDQVRQYFQLEAPVLLGHSWGVVLALEYALRYPTRVSHLILMNPAPASVSDLTVARKTYLEKVGDAMDRQREILASSAYHEGDPDAVTARYRIHFKPALRRPEHYEALISRMEVAFHSQGKEGIVKARAVEDQLMRDTWQVPDYDLLPKLHNLRIPTLVITGDHDFFPVEIAGHIAQSLPDAELVTIRDCGHFSYLECPAEVRSALKEFLELRQ